MHQQVGRPAAAPQTKLPPQFAHATVGADSGDREVRLSVTCQHSFDNPALDKAGRRLCRLVVAAFGDPQATVGKAGRLRQGVQDNRFAGVC